MLGWPNHLIGVANHPVWPGGGLATLRPTVLIYIYIYIYIFKTKMHFKDVRPTISQVKCVFLNKVLEKEVV
jgi:hypothetical protein